MHKVLEIREIEKISRHDNHGSQIHMAAVYYASIGLYVVPLEVNGKVLPPKRLGINYRSASRKKEVLDRWFGEEGRFRGWNLGIACGREDGVFAVDVDLQTYRGGNGYETLAALEEENGPLIGPTALTPGGGKHILYNWDMDCSTSSGRLGDGIDTRGGDVDECRSHIVAWPSLVNGKPYKWEWGGEMGVPPAWIPIGLKKEWRVKHGLGRGNEEVGPEDSETRYSIPQLAKMLECVHPDTLDYDEWVNIGMAIQSQREGGDGLELWDKWSRQGERYKEGECTIRWNSFNGEGTVRVGTLVHHAKGGGFDPRRLHVVALETPDMPDMPDTSDAFDAVIAEYNSKYAVVVMGGSVMVMSTKYDPDPMIEKYRFHSAKGFALMTSNERITIEVSGKSKQVPKSEIWLSNENRRQYLDGLQFKPGFPPEIGEALNSWDGWAFEGQGEGTWGMFKEHILKVICNHDKGHYEWVLDWMADVIQEPMKPKGTAIILMGKEGAGKGAFADIFGRLFGRHYKPLHDEAHLVGKFNSHLEQTILIFADEVTYGGSKKVAGKLKALVTEPRMMCERKKIDATSYLNCAHVIVASNEDWVIPAGPHSRRWFVVEVSDEHRCGRAHFSEMHGEMENGGYEGMMKELKEREIKKDLSIAPETALLADQRGRAALTGSINQWWYEQLDLGSIDVPTESTFGAEEIAWPDRVGKTALKSHYQAWCKERNRKEENAISFNKKMGAFGGHLVRLPLSADYLKRPEVWELMSLADSVIKFKDATGVEL